MRYLFLLVALSAALHAEPQVKLTIHVVDSATGAGVPNATLYVVAADDSGLIADAPDTDSMGLSSAMVPENSSFEVMAGAQGYPEAHSQPVAIGTEPRSVSVALVTASGIFGHVVDADTKQPLARVLVQLWQMWFVRGIPQISPAGRPTQTDAEGRFQSATLPPGDYIVETSAPPQTMNADTPGPRYFRQVWPGGRDFADAVPVSVPSGASFDFGTIAIVKKTLATVKFRVVGDCTGQLYAVRLVQTYAKAGFDRASAEVECGRTASFSQVPDGSYGLVATPEAEPADSPGKAADAWIEVSGSDLNVDLPLQPKPLVKISGRVITESGDNVEGIPGAAVTFLSGADIRGLASGMPLASDSAKSDAKGSFEQPIYVPFGGKVAVKLSGSSANLYVEALQYNGTRVASDRFTLNEFAMTQDLDIVCSDKFGLVSGKISSKDNSSADVLLIPWPNDGGNYPSDVLEVRAGPEGEFSLSPVRPGRYKALAVRSADRAKFEAPFRLLTALPNAADVDVTQGSGNTVSIEKLED